MLSTITVFLGSGTLLYVWLTAVTAPLLGGLRSALQAARTDRWTPALRGRLAVLFVATMVPAAALFLASAWAPATALAVLDSPGLNAGSLCGATLFVVRGTILGLPRLSAGAEVAMAAVLEAWSPDAQIQSFEEYYRAFVIDRPEESRALRPAALSIGRH